MGSRRRSNLDIQASILRALSNDDLTLNKIVTYTNLNRKLARKYVQELSGMGFLRVENHRPFDSYSTTERGMEWLTKYKLLLRDMRPGPPVPDDGF